MLCEEKFSSIYGRDPQGISFSPYRICPIGAHSDHNLGKITGLAIDQGIHIAYKPKKNGVVEMCSLQFPKRAQWHIKEVGEKTGDWADYLRGATWALSARYPLTVGLSGVIEGSLDYLLENTLQSKITGWTADYLVVCAFMAVSVSVISKWIVPMLIVCAVVTVVTFLVCFYFGRRFGGTNDFERTLGLYGTCTGTVPSGIALVRIVDPNFKTSTAVELGACNLVMMASTPIYIIILAFASGTMEMLPAIGGLAVCCVVYLVILKLTKTWGKPTYSWKGNK